MAGMTPRTDRARAIRRIAFVGNAVLAVLATVLICVFVGIIVLFGVSAGYADPDTPAAWARTIAEAVGALSVGVTVSTIGLIVAATASVVFARARHRTGLEVAALCAGMFAATLLFAAIGGSAQLRDIAARAEAAAVEVGPIPVPWPTPTPEPLTLAEANSDLRRMVELSLSAAVGPVVGADGLPVDVGLMIPETSACGETGTKLSMTLSVRTDDNAGSLERILAAWTAEGYASDRAIQIDIRYSESLPVESLGIRDSSTIDGMIWMQILSQCVPAGAE
jgi:hypothetical protein